MRVRGFAIYLCSIVVAIATIALAGCKPAGVEAHCFATNEATDDGGPRLLGYQCYVKPVTCESRRSAKAEAVAAAPDAKLMVGDCKKTTAMYCGAPKTPDSFLICAPTATECDALAVDAENAGRPTLDCKKMTRDELDQMRANEKLRREAAAKAP